MLTEDVLKRVMNPIILSTFPKRISNLLEEQRYELLKLNDKLSEALLKYPKELRSEKAIDEVMGIISLMHSPILLENFEMLFDPRYKINAIKIFSEIARRQRIAVKWCGKVSTESLEYATPEYEDYNSFRINDYDIICVI